MQPFENLVLTINIQLISQYLFVRPVNAADGERCVDMVDRPQDGMICQFVGGNAVKLWNAG